MPKDADANGHTLASDDYGSYAGHGLGFNPAGNSGAGSLFITGEEVATKTTRFAEISIPTLDKTVTDPSLLPAASWLQPLTDVIGPALRRPYAATAGDPFSKGIAFPGNDTMLWTIVGTYDNGPAPKCLGKTTRASAMSSRNSSGMYGVQQSSGIGWDRQASGWITEIAPGWRGVGKLGSLTHFSGQCGISISGSSGHGCMAVGWDWTRLASDTAGAKKLAFFDLDHPMTGFTEYGTNVGGAVWPNTATRYGVVFFGVDLDRRLTKPPARAWYGYGRYKDWREGETFPNGTNIQEALKPGRVPYATYGNPAGWPAEDIEGRYYEDGCQNWNKGGHNYGLCPVLWVIDPHDLVSAYNGTLDPTKVPARKYYLDQIAGLGPLLARNPCAFSGGYGAAPAFDRARNRIYLAQLNGEQRGYGWHPVIHVFKVNGQ
jgi:hypothetical protein